MRGQYVGYRDEPGVAKGSDTETYCALRVHVDSWRWAGVPFSIRAGKALAGTVQEAVVELRQPPRLLFADRAHTPEPNVLRFRLKPDDTITLEMQAKLPGDRLVSGRVDLDVAYEAALGGEGPEAYRAPAGRRARGRPAAVRAPGHGRGRLARGRPRAGEARARDSLRARLLGAGGGHPRGARPARLAAAARAAAAT